MRPIYCLENTWPGPGGKKEGVDRTSKLIQAFVGAPVTIDAAGLGSAAHRVRHYWTNFCEVALLQNAFPREITPSPSLTYILDKDHIASAPLVASTWPFVGHDFIGRPRVCLPTIMSYPGSFAFRRRTNGNPGEVEQRTTCLGQAMDGNTLRWMGAFLSAAHTLP